MPKKNYWRQTGMLHEPILLWFSDSERDPPLPGYAMATQPIALNLRNVPFLHPTPLGYPSY